MAMKENPFVFYDRPVAVEHGYDSSEYFIEALSLDKYGLEFREKNIKTKFPLIERELDVMVAWEDLGLVEGGMAVTIMVDDFVVVNYAEGELNFSALGFNGWYRNILGENGVSSEWKERLWQLSSEREWEDINFFWLMDNFTGEVNLEGNLEGYREELQVRKKPEFNDALYLGVEEEFEGRDGSKFMLGLGGRLLSFPDNYVWSLEGTFKELDSNYVEEKSLFGVRVAKNVDMSRFDQKDGSGKTRELVETAFGINGQGLIW